MNKFTLIAAIMLGILPLSSLTSCYYYYPTYAPVYATNSVPTKEGTSVGTVQTTTYVPVSPGYVAQPYWPFWAGLFNWGLWGGWWGHGGGHGHGGGGHGGGGHGGGGGHR